jgi:MATE family multidrug resistance protein
VSETTARASDTPPGDAASGLDGSERGPASEPRAPDAGDLVGRAEVFRIAWPIIVANAAVPLLGLADTAVIGHTGGAADLGAIALGALLFQFLYWSFGFLRMGTTGFVAQAAGAGDELEVRAALARALGVGAVAGLTLVLLRGPIELVSFRLLGGGAEVEAAARAYFSIRIAGAPATLCTFAASGLLVGLGRSRELLLVQLFLNALNLALDLLFAGALGWGVRGIALGTVISEWMAVVVALGIVVRVLGRRRRAGEPFWPIERLRDRRRFAATLGANADILIRTLFLLLGFAFFLDRSARFGELVLAANHVLLQFVSFAAFFLDGWAFACESLVGAAFGAGRRARFDAAVRRSTELSGVTAAVLCAAILVLGGPMVSALTDLAPVRETAIRYLPFAALYVAVAFAAFQLDGIFIGTTRTRDMRNASALALLVFLAGWWALRGLGNGGLWLAFVAYATARALTLGARYPALRAAVPERARQA